MTEQRIPERIRLKDNHPVSQKVYQLYDLAEKLGITFHFDYVMHLEVRGDDTEYIFEDLEADSGQPEGNPGSFPPCCEWKITKENPKYAEAQRKENEEYARRHKLERETAEAKYKAEVEVRAKAEAERTKKIDLAELARLKRKYEND